MPKRKSTKTTSDNADAAQESPQPEQQDIPEIDSEDERLDWIDNNCDQVRHKIDAFISNGEMKIGQFQDAINVSSLSYLDFKMATEEVRQRSTRTPHRNLVKSVSYFQRVSSATK